MAAVIQEEVENLIRDAKHIINVSRKRLLMGSTSMKDGDRSKPDNGLSDSDSEFSDSDDETPETFHEKLMALYAREYGNFTDCKAIRCDPLRKFASENDINYLVVNLYTDRKLFTLIIRTRSMVRYESRVSEYDEEMFSTYFDRGELPPQWAVQAIKLDPEFQLFYCGGIVTEISYYRNQMAMLGSFFVHLKFSTEARYAILEHQSKTMTKEELQQFESALVAQSAGPLCLDPNPVVSIISNRLQYEKGFASRTSLKKLIKHKLPAKRAKKKALEQQLETTPELIVMRSVLKKKPSPVFPASVSELEAVEPPSMDLYPTVPDLDLISMDKENISQSDPNEYYSFPGYYA